MDDRHGDYSLRLSPTFVDGVLLTAAAIPDAALIYCGSTCINENVTQTYLHHDWGQTLVGRGPQTRLFTTFTDFTLAPMGVAPVVQHHVERLLAGWRPGLILIAELSRMTIAGDDLSDVARAIGQFSGLPTVAAKSRYLSRDHDTAFRNLLRGVVEALPDGAFEGGPVGGQATVMGYFWERNEGDQEANVAELEAMLRALGLAPTPTWLSHAPFARLAEAATSSLLVALPGARDAAHELAARSGARVVEVDLPVGLAGTTEWLETVAGAAGAQQKVRPFVEASLAVVVPRVDWGASRHLAGRRAALAASPDWLRPVARMMREDLGMELAVELRRGRFAEGEGENARQAVDPGRRHDPSVRTVNAHIGAEVAGRGLDVVVASSWERSALAGDAASVPFVEFGYPSFVSHELARAPRLGFPGVLTWAQRLAEAIAGGKPR